MRYMIAVLFLSACVSAQTPRTLKQCNADYVTWYSDSMNAGPLFPRLTVKQLGARLQALMACKDNYPNTGDQGRWGFQANLYGNALSIRAVSFLKRHKLWDQFIQEDENGER